jgi:ribulose-phosphate 3-epimerase
MKIYPTILAHSKKELEEQLSKLKWAKRVQLDIIDGRFVGKKTYSIIKTAAKLRGKYVQADLMVNRPSLYLPKLKFAKEIIYHPETGQDLIDKIHKMKKKAGLSFNPKTAVRKYKDQILRADIAQVMTVHPGRMGAKFLPGQLKKIQQIKKINPKIIVGTDGGTSRSNIKKIVKAGADYITSGSSIQKADNPQKEYRFLTQSK